MSLTDLSNGITFENSLTSQLGKVGRADFTFAGSSRIANMTLAIMQGFRGYQIYPTINTNFEVKISTEHFLPDLSAILLTGRSQKTVIWENFLKYWWENWESFFW